jgi:hypothetical protein
MRRRLTPKSSASALLPLGRSERCFSKNLYKINKSTLPFSPPRSPRIQCLCPAADTPVSVTGEVGPVPWNFGANARRISGAARKVVLLRPRDARGRACRPCHANFAQGMVYRRKGGADKRPCHGHTKPWPQWQRTQKNLEARQKTPNGARHRVSSILFVTAHAGPRPILVMGYKETVAKHGRKAAA